MPRLRINDLDLVGGVAHILGAKTRTSRGRRRFLSAAGGSPYVISQRLGHASIRTTYDIYGHLSKAEMGPLRTPWIT